MTKKTQTYTHMCTYMDEEHLHISFHRVGCSHHVFEFKSLPRQLYVIYIFSDAPQNPSARLAATQRKHTMFCCWRFVLEIVSYLFFLGRGFIYQMKRKEPRAQHKYILWHVIFYVFSLQYVCVCVSVCAFFSSFSFIFGQEFLPPGEFLDGW